MLELLWQKLVRRYRAMSSPLSTPNPEDICTAGMTRASYIQSELPISNELRTLFDPAEPLVIFDIGACEGEDSIRYARAFANACLYAFEPLPDNMRRLRKQLSDYGMTRVEAFELALSDTDGTAVFHVSSGAPQGMQDAPDWDYGNKSSSLLPPADVLQHYPWLKFQEEIEVRTATLAKFCSMRGIDRIDLIHMDVQGAELRVLEGAGDLLRAVRAVWLEIETVPLYEGQPLADEVQRFMESQGFIKGKDTLADNPGISGDHLYIRPASFQRGLDK
jgi:FkbM family methyltransferase